MIQELENSASSDAIVREKIARLPPEVSEAGSLEKLQSAKDGQQLLEKVNFLWFVFLSNNSGLNWCFMKANHWFEKTKITGLKRNS